VRSDVHDGVMTETAAPALIPADRFARIVVALASQLCGAVGADWLFAVTGAADILVWRPVDGTLVLRLVADAADEHSPVLRTVTVTAGAERAFDVIAGDRLVIGETRGAEAAFSIALDYVTAPLRAERQHDHDAFAV
jgi:hypothetical protein